MSLVRLARWSRHQSTFPPSGQTTLSVAQYHGRRRLYRPHTVLQCLDVDPGMLECRGPRSGRPGHRVTSVHRQQRLSVSLLSLCCHVRCMHRHIGRYRRSKHTVRAGFKGSANWAVAQGPPQKTVKNYYLRKNKNTF